MKKALSFLLLTVLLIFTASTPSFAADETATLYSYYGDNMLFKQNEAAVIAGKAKAGTEIICTLLNSKNDERENCNEPLLLGRPPRSDVSGLSRSRVGRPLS